MIRDRVDCSFLSAQIDHCFLARAVSVQELVIHLCHLAPGLGDELHALDVSTAHFFKRSRTAILLLPPGKLGEDSTARSSSLLGFGNVHANAEQICGKLADSLVGRGPSSDDESLERGGVGREDGGYAGLDGQELGLEDGSRMGLGGYSVYTGRTTVLHGEEELAKNVLGDDFRKRKVKAEMAVVPRWGGLDKVVVPLPVMVGISVTDVLSGEGTVFVAEHGDLSIDGGWMGEKVGGGETLWGGICGGDGEQERRGSAQGEKRITGCREGDDGGRVVAGERGDEALCKLVRTGVSVQEREVPGLKPHLATHQLEMFPRTVPPGTGSGPIFERSSGPPQAWRRESSQLQVRTFMRFMPLASDISMGATRPRKREAMKEETKEMRAVRR